jgi:hypothetical protein
MGGGYTNEKSPEFFRLWAFRDRDAQRDRIPTDRLWVH